MLTSILFVLALFLNPPDSLTNASLSIVVLVVGKESSNVYFDCQNINIWEKYVYTAAADCKEPVQYNPVTWDSRPVNRNRYKGLVRVNNKTWDRCLGGKTKYYQEQGLLFQIICLETSEVTHD